MGRRSPHKPRTQNDGAVACSTRPCIDSLHHVAAVAVWAVHSASWTCNSTPRNLQTRSTKSGRAMPKENLFIRLVEEAEKFCGHFGVGKQTIIETLEEKSDWAFIIKVDALHETACRDLVSRVLALKDGTQPEELFSFISD